MPKIALASDHAGFELKEFLKPLLSEKGYELNDFGTNSDESCDYPDFAHPAANAVETGICDFGIGICGSGNGMQMTLNKHQGIRAALCWLPELASLAREHNDANFLVLPARFISKEEAVAILDAFLNAKFEGGRHQRRVNKIPNNISVEGEIYNDKSLI
ncbi:MAG: ribose 5-phosphate isomerase B [Muribaculaceae bacterium]|nr:ribose 5-phosphate isomerase B [Muribaculaceae bacterium]